MTSHPAKPIMIAAGVIGIILLQFQIVPFVLEVMNSPSITGHPEQGGQATAISNTLTEKAYSHCNDHIRKIQPIAGTPVFGPEPTKAWDIGFGRYIVMGQVDFLSENGNTRRSYVCRIQTGENDSSRWELSGLELSSP